MDFWGPRMWKLMHQVSYCYSDNPDEEFAKKNYGSVQAYKDMLKRKIDKLLNASNCN